MLESINNPFVFPFIFSIELVRKLEKNIISVPDNELLLLRSSPQKKWTTRERERESKATTRVYVNNDEDSR